MELQSPLQTGMHGSDLPWSAGWPLATVRRQGEAGDRAISFPSSEEAPHFLAQQTLAGLPGHMAQAAMCPSPPDPPNAIVATGRLLGRLAALLAAQCHELCVGTEELGVQVPAPPLTAALPP